ncbi:MAG: hypothetical protein WCN95_14435, partial [bacterium]
FHFGKVTNFNIIVELSESPGFSGTPVTRARLKKPGKFKLMGLREGGYYLRAFNDQNGNGELDDWESFGFVKDQGMFANDYKVQSLGIPGNVIDRRVVLRDRDTDNDRLPDAWEYENFGSLFTAGAGAVYGSPGYSDTDGDGLNDLHEYELGTDPRKADTDGDGVPDGMEATWVGMSATSMDDDNDGIPTAVELQWNSVAGYQAVSDMNPSLGDSDSDGVSDLMEVAAGSSPINPATNSVVGVSAIIQDASGRPVISWAIHSNIKTIKVRYHLMRSDDLVNWTEIGSLVSPGNTNVMTGLTDATAATERLFFYRLSLTYEP